MTNGKANINSLEKIIMGTMFSFSVILFVSEIVLGIYDNRMLNRDNFCGIVQEQTSDSINIDAQWVVYYDKPLTKNDSIIKVFEGQVKIILEDEITDILTTHTYEECLVLSPYELNESGTIRIIITFNKKEDDKEEFTTII